MGAIALIGQQLDIPIIGFNQTSPKAQRPESDCDFVASAQGQLNFIEVKRNAAQDKQVLPEELEWRLNEIEVGLPFILTAELIDRNYNCTNIDRHLDDMQDHVKQFLSSNSTPATLIVPEPFEAEPFKISFQKKSMGQTGGRFFKPVFSEDLEPYLLGPGRAGRDGKPMVPMVTQAINKGADYLFCRVPGWEGLDIIVKKIFADITLANYRTFFTNDNRLDSLRGIVLFTRFDNYRIVNNLNAPVDTWIVV